MKTVKFKLYSKQSCFNGK